MNCGYNELPSTLGKVANLSFPDGSTMQWQVVDEIRRNEDAEKILILQRLKAIASSEQFMFRFCYYIIGKKPRMRGRWVFGQFAPFISGEDFSAIIMEAQAKKWF